VCIPGSEPPQYFCLFGIYLSVSHVHGLLAASQQQNQGELDLSAALRSWIYRDGGLAYEVDGEFIDGTPTGFCSTVTRLPPKRVGEQEELGKQGRTEEGIFLLSHHPKLSRMEM